MLVDVMTCKGIKPTRLKQIDALLLSRKAKTGVSTFHFADNDSHNGITIISQLIRPPMKFNCSSLCILYLRSYLSSTLFALRALKQAGGVYREGRHRLHRGVWHRHLVTVIFPVTPIRGCLARPSSSCRPGWRVNLHLAMIDPYPRKTTIEPACSIVACEREACSCLFFLCW